MLPNVKASLITAFDASFASVMAGLGLDQAAGYVTALSGGPDSTALALLTQRYADATGKHHHAVIVDHGLRDDSGDEAERVQTRLHRFGIDSDIIQITAPRPIAGLQEWARTNRHQALLSAARQKKAALLFAHHASDQVETVAMRLLKSSGLAGLCGIACHRMQHDVVVARPVLGWMPDQLKAVCHHLNCEFEIDPSNQDNKFERVRIRKLLADLDHKDRAISDVALSSVQLRRLSTCAARLSVVANRFCDRIIDHAVEWHPAGYASVKMAALADLPQSFWALVMRRLIMAVGGGHYGAATVALDQLRQRCDDGVSATIGGCHFSPITASSPHHASEASYHLFRETGRKVIHMPIAAGQEAVFAGCWLVKSAQAGMVHAWADKPQIQIDYGAASYAKPMPDGWHLLPYRARQAIPMLTTLDGGSIYPQLGLCEGTQSPAGVVVRFLGMARRPRFLADIL
ncbi:tRNA lysidine(34) synthetase TilS, partial [Alphaproteobacteria bacterium]|nr:tRNA lysidine(34) synthetase TilS [Alphaproteobacteria bacterium]